MKFDNQFQAKDFLVVHADAHERHWVGGVSVKKGEDFIPKLGTFWTPNLIDHSAVPKNEKDYKVGKWAKGDNVTGLACSFAEIDNLPIAQQFELLSKLVEEGMPEPSGVVYSGSTEDPEAEAGKSLHVFWRYTRTLANDYESLRRWKKIQSALIHVLGSDPNIKDPARRMRLGCGRTYQMGPFDRSKTRFRDQKVAWVGERVDFEKLEAWAQSIEIPEVFTSKSQATFVEQDDPFMASVISDGRTKQPCPWCGSEETGLALQWSADSGFAYCHRERLGRRAKTEGGVKFQDFNLDMFLSSEKETPSVEAASSEESSQSSIYRKVVVEVSTVDTTLRNETSDEINWISDDEVNQVARERFHDEIVGMGSESEGPEPVDYDSLDPLLSGEARAALIELHKTQLNLRGLGPRSAFVRCNDVKFLHGTEEGNRIRDVAYACGRYGCPTCGPYHHAATRAAFVAVTHAWSVEHPDHKAFAIGARGSACDLRGARLQVERWAEKDPEARWFAGYATDPETIIWILQAAPEAFPARGKGLAQDLKRTGVEGLAKALAEDAVSRVNVEAWRAAGSSKTVLVRSTRAIRSKISKIKDFLFNRRERDGRGTGVSVRTTTRARDLLRPIAENMPHLRPVIENDELVLDLREVNARTRQMSAARMLAQAAREGWVVTHEGNRSRASRLDPDDLENLMLA